MNETNRIAVLIDAENTSPRKIEAVLTELSNHGHIQLKRAYGNWSEPHLTPWAYEVNRLAIRTFQQFNCAAGKNAADIALAIDAMDLLHSGLYDAFVIVSSDSDYTPLAIKLRESGAFVMGVGKHHTPESFRNACDQFLYLEDIDPLKDFPLMEEFPLLEDFMEEQEETSAQPTCGLIDDLFGEDESEEEPDESGFRFLDDLLLEEEETPASEWDSISDLESEVQEDANSQPKENRFWEVVSGPDEEYDIVWGSLMVDPPEGEIPGIEGVHTLLRLVYNDCKQEDGYARLSDTGNLIKEIRPDFNYRDYGFCQLNELLQAFPERYRVVTHHTPSRKRIMAFCCCD